MFRALTCCGVALGLAGCGSGEVPTPVDVEIKAALSPLEQAIAFIDHYAKGHPMSSEVSQFEPIVKAVREKDPAKADALEKGFAKLKTLSGAQLKSQAAALVRQLSPNTAPR